MGFNHRVCWEACESRYALSTLPRTDTLLVTETRQRSGWASREEAPRSREGVFAFLAFFYESCIKVLFAELAGKSFITAKSRHNMPKIERTVSLSDCIVTDIGKENCVVNQIMNLHTLW